MDTQQQKFKKSFMKFKTVTFSIFTFLCLFNIYGQEYEVNFEKEYIKQNENNVSIEINEVQELVYIILANTEYANDNPRMVKQDTEYYKEMKKHFSKYSDLSIVKKFNKLLEENLLYYFMLAANAYGYEFEGNNIVPTGIYIFPGKGVGNLKVEQNPIETYIIELEEFAQKTEFKEFYKQKKSYYDNLKSDYQKYAQIDLQKKWLEDRFDYKINSFRVLTSPLVASMHATHTFKNNGFKETLLFLPTIHNEKERSKEFDRALNTRVIFTEIDHNYVGKVSEKFSEQINSIFDDREKWVDSSNEGAQYYPNPIKVFDEYLTWGLFILYANDNYEQEITNQVIENINELMIKKGFPKGEEFNSHLLDIYKASESIKIIDLYPEILQWSSKQ
jgi:hypothetical protein